MPSTRHEFSDTSLTELLGRGHPVFRVSISSADPARTRARWAIDATTEEPACQA